MICTILEELCDVHVLHFTGWKSEWQNKMKIYFIQLILKKHKRKHISGHGLETCEAATMLKLRRHVLLVSGTPQFYTFHLKFHDGRKLG